MQVKTELKLSTLSYVILYVKDTDKAVSFYKDILGFAVKMQEGGWVELETGSTTLALHGENKHQTRKSAHGDGKTTVVFSVEDPYAAYETLKARGVKFNNEPHMVCEAGDKIGTSADFSDLDGNSLSIFGFVPAKK